MRKKLIAVVLAAGQGTRMHSPLAKVLHPLAGAPMLSYVLDALLGLNPEKILVVTGHQEEQVRQAVTDYAVQFVSQKEQLGTGHALQQAQLALGDFSGHLLVINGDTPLLTTPTLKALVEEHVAQDRVISLLSANLSDPTGYGRILRDEAGRVVKIAEEKDATGKQLAVQEVATGVYCFASPLIFSQLGQLSPDNAQAEYYLTDVVPINYQNGSAIYTQIAKDPQEVMGINDHQQLAQAEAVLRARINQQWLRSGVKMLNPAATYIEKHVRLGKTTILYPNTFIEGQTQIGQGCLIGPGCHIKNSQLGNEVTVRANCVINSSIIQDGAVLGPFAHLRPETIIEKGAKVGNFVEIKKSRIGQDSKVNHLTYLGDTTVGQKVNIGAGTITCNYDGTHKHQTVIEDAVFIGSGTQLIAPVHIGKQAWIGAGSTITKDVPAKALAVSRTRQVNKEKWARRKGKA